ncbi:MAG: hypothetical protein HDR88_12840 [Bacteroides sp.]|nr:hypothetical protein [Bacteroides sp.]
MKRFFTSTAVFAVIAGSGFGANLSHTTVREEKAKAERQIHPVAGEEMLRERNVTPVRPVMRKADSNVERNLTLIYKEDFSKFVAGSEDNIDSQDLAEGYVMGDPYVSPDYTSEPGCWGFGIYQAGGVCALNYPGLGGVFSTPEGYYGGRLIIKFRAKASIPETPMTISVCTGGIWNPYMATENFGAYVLEPEDGWVDLEFEADNNYTTEDCFVQFNSNFYHPGLLLDDIEIYRDNDYVWIPTTTEAYAFTSEGFTADWGRVATADSYLFSLYKEETMGDSPVTGVMDIAEAAKSANGEEFDGGWIIDLGGAERVGAGKGLNGEDAIVLAYEGDAITYPVTSGIYTSFAFTLVPSVGYSGEGGALYLQVYGDGKWKAVSMMPFDYIDASGYDCKFNLSMVAGNYTGVRLVVTGLEEDLTDTPFYISNLAFETGPKRNYIPVIEELETTDTRIVLDSLDPWAEYYFTVKVKAGEFVSEATPMRHALGVASPEVAEPTDIDKDAFSFTANWSETPKATAYETSVYWCEKIEKDHDNFILIDESFSKCNEGTVENSKDLGNLDDVISLDQYADVTGWLGFGNCMADGMLGVLADEYLEGYCLFAPEVILVSSNPRYDVSMRVYSESSDWLTVMDMYTQDYAQIPVTQGFNELNFTLEGQGIAAMGMYMENGGMCLIDDFKMTQRVTAGDERLAILGVFTSDAEDGTSLSLSGENMINGEYFYTVKAIQRYYNAETTSDASDRMFVNFEQSGIKNHVIENDVVEIARYDISGRKVSPEFKGIQIVKYSDGTSRKVIVM